MNEQDLVARMRKETVVPSLSTEDVVTRALTYPYPRPSHSFLFHNGEAVALPKNFDSDDKRYTAVVAIGSNASPVQLLRKFGTTMDIPVIRVKMYGVDVVYATGMAGYGSIPATVTASPNTIVHTHVTLLKTAAFLRMNETEYGYYLCKLSPSHFPSIRIEFVDHHRSGDVFFYVARSGVFKPNGKPIALQEIPADKRVFSAMRQPDILATVAQLVKSPHPTIDLFIRQVVSDREYLISTIKRLNGDGRVDDCFEFVEFP